MKILNWLLSLIRKDQKKINITRYNKVCRYAERRYCNDKHGYIEGECWYDHVEYLAARKYLNF